MSGGLKRRVVKLEAVLEGNQSVKVFMVLKQRSGVCSCNGVDYPDETACRAAIGAGPDDLQIWLNVQDMSQGAA